MKTKEFKIIKIESDINQIKAHIDGCQVQNHVQQVAYSTYHGCLTQICFTCEKIRTNMDLKEKA